jgi:putative ABC transport system permease protein
VREIQYTVNLLGCDLTVQQAGTGFPELSSVTLDEVEALRSTRHVKRALAVGMRMTRFRASRYFFVLGVGPRVPDVPELSMLEGRVVAPESKEFMLGYRAARSLDVGAGGELVLHRNAIPVVGVYRSGRAVLDRGSMMPLEAYRELFNIGERVNLVFLELDDPANADRVIRSIEERFPDLEVSWTDNLTSHYGQVDEIGQRVAQLASIALAIAALGIANVMLINVSERRQEIGILRAIGWGKGRLLLVVLGEGVVVALLGGLTGIPLAQIVLSLLPAVDTIGYAPGRLPPAVAVACVALSGLAGALGSLPAVVRALQVRPAESLRAE